MNRKEKNEQKHKMAVAIFREMDPEKREAFIEENQKKHVEEFTALKLEQDKKREDLKLGREYVYKNHVLMFHGRIGGHNLAAGALLCTLNQGDPPQIAYKIAYTICSRKDRMSAKAAKGYVGKRLMDEVQHLYVFTIALSRSGALIPERLAQLIRLHIELDVVTKRVQVPSHMHRAILRGDEPSQMMLLSSDTYPTSRKVMRSATRGDLYAYRSR